MHTLSSPAALPRPPARLAGAWLWLFPATYLVHIGEEYVAGFPSWLSRVAGVALTPEQFLVLNAAFWVAMAGAVVVAIRRPRWEWLPVALGAVVLANAVLHLGGSFLTRSYSPGAVSAALLWVPLGSVALRRAWSRVPRARFAAGIVAGVAAHAVVSWLALNAERTLGS